MPGGNIVLGWLQFLVSTLDYTWQLFVHLYGRRVFSASVLGGVHDTDMGRGRSIPACKPNADPATPKVVYLIGYASSFLKHRLVLGASAET